MNLDDLNQFTGSETIYRHLFGLHYTEGIKYLAEQAGAYWLIDAVASYQPEKVVVGNPRLRAFQLWRLEVNDNRGVLTCREDSGFDPAITQRIEFTDFPLAEFEWYVCDGIMLLKTEY